jgi:hypothetical protein
MNYETRQAVDRFFERLPGWMFLVSGLTLLGFVVITPAWQESRELEHQKEVLQLQTDRIAEQAQAYENFQTAMKNDDPVLLERLAFYHLRLKPVGAMPLMGQAGIEPPARTRPLLVSDKKVQRGPTPEVASAEVAKRLSESLISVEAWLQKPLPREGVDYQKLPEVRSRLARWSLEPKSRNMMFGAALVLVVMGLAPTRRVLGGASARASALEKI